MNARCAHSGRQAISTVECRWPSGTIVSWYLDPASRFGSLNSVTALSAIAAGIDLWAQASGVKLLRVDSPDRARVLIFAGSIDRQNGILGQTELPCDGRADVQHTMVFDSAEAWTARFLFQVAAHEFGHALGIGHAPSGVWSVMGPYYDQTLEALQPWEIGQAIERYGPPVAPPQPAGPDSVSQSYATDPFSIKLEVDTPGEYLVEVKPTFQITLSRVK